ncbi:MAG: BrnT family toxin [Alphaproteobacteria bacterium]
MEFDWDPAKDAANLKDHGFDFAFAATIFAGPVVERVDDRMNYGEMRINAIGFARGRLIVVTYTDRGDVRWIIFARKATKAEEQRYRQGW